MNKIIDFDVRTGLLTLYSSFYLVRLDLFFSLCLSINPFPQTSSINLIACANLSVSHSALFLVHQEWTDEHLTWNPDDYSGINEMVVKWWDIWTPEIRSWAAASQINQEQARDLEHPRVNSSGHVFMLLKDVVPCYCNVDLYLFPFDRHNCSFGFVDGLTFRISQLNLMNLPRGVEKIFDSYEINPEWFAVSVQVRKNQQNATHSMYLTGIMVDLVLKRRTNFYLYSTGVPYLTSGLLVISSFLLSLASMRRYYLLIVSMLIYSCILLQLAARLGSHSIKVPYAVKCVVYSMLLVTISITVNIVSGCVIDKLARRKHSCMPRTIASVLESPWLGTLCCLNPTATGESDNSTSFPPASSNIDIQSSSTSHRDHTDPRLPTEWHLLQQLLDRICFVSFIVASIIYHS